MNAPREGERREDSVKRSFRKNYGCLYHPPGVEPVVHPDSQRVNNFESKKWLVGFSPTEGVGCPPDQPRCGQTMRLPPKSQVGS